MSKHRSLSIIIPNYNGQELIPQFFPSVVAAAAACRGEVQIVFVDDCSTDASLKEIRRFEAGVDSLKVVSTLSNGGFSKACNCGIAAASGEILFFLNTDVALDVDYFEYYSDWFDDPDLFAITTCGLRHGSDQQIDGIKVAAWRTGMLRVTDNIFDDALADAALTPPWLSFGVQGAYFFARAEMVKALDGFDEMFSPFIFEETDLAYRSLKRGWKIIYEPRCRGYHQVSTSLRAVAPQRRIDILSLRNKLLFTWKNIHSPRLLASHIVWHLLRLLTLKPIVWQATIQALAFWKRVKSARRSEKQLAVKSDAQLLHDATTYLSKLQF